MKHDRTPYTWWCDENEGDGGGSVDEVGVDDDSGDDHYDSNIVTNWKIFGHLINGKFGKEKIKEIMKVKKIESENQSAKKVKVEKNTDQDKKSGLQLKTLSATM